MENQFSPSIGNATSPYISRPLRAYAFGLPCRFEHEDRISSAEIIDINAFGARLRLPPDAPWRHPAKGCELILHTGLIFRLLALNGLGATVGRASARELALVFDTPLPLGVGELQEAIETAQGILAGAVGPRPGTGLNSPRHAA